jgi:hypothetical protein
MRVLCVGRHQFLSEHLGRYFAALGAECESVVGSQAVPPAAARFEPHIVVSESDLLTPAQMDLWSREPALADVPVIAVSLTRRPVEAPAISVAGVAGVIYLPALDMAQARSLLAAAYQPRGVASPPGWPLTSGLPAPSETAASPGR